MKYSSSVLLFCIKRGAEGVDGEPDVWYANIEGFFGSNWWDGDCNGGVYSNGLNTTEIVNVTEFRAILGYFLWLAS